MTNPETTIVSLQPCNTYDDAAVEARLRQSIEDLGGLDKYIQAGDRILLKANLLMKKKPEEATTTHPAVVKALASILIAHGASILIGDSPGGPFTEGLLRGIYAASGMERVAAETGAALNRNTAAFQKANPDGLLLKRIEMTDMLNDVDKVITVSKMKTHGMMAFTGAVKNLFGVIPGLIKAEYHLNMPSHTQFADALIDICLCVAPVLSFMDGIEAMEGHGPSGGTPRKMNVLLASNDPFALDKTACAIIGLDEARVPILTQAEARGICRAGLDGITFAGAPWTDFAVRDFDIPETHLVMNPKELPRFAQKFVNRFLQPRPVFTRKTCTGCGDCAKCCPAHVIEMRGRNPYVTLDNCIRCFCCQELCPKNDIKAYRPRLLRTISRPKRKP